MIELHFAVDALKRTQVPDPVLSGLRDALQTSRANAERAGRLTVTVLQNEMKTLAARRRQARDESRRVIEGGTKRLDAARDAAQRVLEALLRENEAPAPRVDASTRPPLSWTVT